MPVRKERWWCDDRNGERGICEEEKLESHGKLNMLIQHMGALFWVNLVLMQSEEFTVSILPQVKLKYSLSSTAIP